MADLIIFDPPYTIRQAKELYNGLGVEFLKHDAQTVGNWKVHKDVCRDLLAPGGIFLHFGYHTNGMGKGRGFEIVEIRLVAHGRAHYDTLCMAERKL